MRHVRTIAIRGWHNVTLLPALSENRGQNYWQYKVKTAKFSGELPSIPFPDGVRIFADVTFDCDGSDPFTANTAIDVAPARLNAYFQFNDVINTCDFRVVTSNRLLHFWSSWVAASLGHTLPITPRDICLQDHVVIRIEPSWPLDFRLLIRTNTEKDADEIMAMLMTPETI